jgi:PilZ domain
MQKKQTTFEERRDSIRANRIITVRHRLIKHNNRKAADPMWQLATTENMSLSGLLFVSALAYHPGDIVELQVVMSGVLEIFNGFGKVIRATRNKGGYYQVGVKYVDLKSRRRSAKTLIASE